MDIVWSHHASNLRLAIFDYIAQDNPLAAIEFDNLLDQIVERILQFPLQAKQGRIKNTYELVFHKHYIVVYEIIENTIFILAIMHTSRQYP